jgi:hypothetical protein
MKRLFPKGKGRKSALSPKERVCIDFYDSLGERMAERFSSEQGYPCLTYCYNVSLKTQSASFVSFRIEIRIEAIDDRQGFCTLHY